MDAQRQLLLQVAVIKTKLQLVVDAIYIQPGRGEQFRTIVNHSRRLTSLLIKSESTTTMSDDVES